MIIRIIEKDGQKLQMMGWGHGISAGDYLLLPNGAGETRYQVETVSYFPDPRDMWSVVATFAPRTARTSESPGF